MKLSKVDSKFGAPMGRYTGPDYLCVEAGKIYLSRVRIDSGGYDSGGAYWGAGEPLWVASDQDGNTRFFRAVSRDAAKREIRETFGEDARFYR